MKVPAELSGVVCKVEAQPGQSVAEGDTLLIIESMKMEIPIAAPRAGIVHAIHVSQGDMVEDDMIVAELS